MIMKDDEYNLPCCEIAQLLAKILYLNEELIGQSARKELVLYRQLLSKSFRDREVNPGPSPSPSPSALLFDGATRRMMVFHLSL